MCGARGTVAKVELSPIGWEVTAELAPDEHRTYARDADGVITAEIWSRANGDVEIVSVKAGGKVKINGVEIDQQGNITTPGEVTAKADTVPIPLSAHLHPTAMGPSGPPQAPPGP